MADALTGIYNKGALLHHLDERIEDARKSGGQVAIFLFDLDHFKEVNDRRGHLAGDDALRTVAREAAETLDEQSLLALIKGNIN